MNDRTIHFIVASSCDDHGNLSWHVVQDVDYLNADTCVWDDHKREWSAMEEYDHALYENMLVDLCAKLSINTETE